MPRKDILLPGLAVGGGLLGLALRRWQWAASYDPGTQLFRSGHPAPLLLLILFAALVLILLVTLRPLRLPGDFLSAFSCPEPGYMALMAASAMLFLGGGLLGVMEGMRELTLWRLAPESHLLTYPVALILCALLAFAAGPATLLVGKGAYRGNPAPVCSLLAVLPPLAGLAWLFATHLAHGTDPVLMGYGFSLAAAALLMLAHYETAAFFHDRAYPRRALFFALTGTFLGVLSLSDGLSPCQLALTAAFSLSALASAHALLRTTSAPCQQERRMPRGAQEETE